MNLIRVKHWMVALVAFLAVAAPRFASAADTYKVDMSHTSIVFAISHLGFSYTYGRFNKASGTVLWDAANPTASRFDLEIDAASLDSNDVKRDEHLRGPDFFNVNQFPVITFKTKSVTAAPDGGLNVAGDLTLHGVTKEVVLPIRKLGEGKSPFNDYRAGFHCEYRINRSEFGMAGMMPMIGDNVAVTVSFEAVRQ